MIISIGASSYQVEVGDINQGSLNELLNVQFSHAKKIILVDENTQEHCLPYVLTTIDALADAEIIAIPAGEESKDLAICAQIWEAFSEYKVRRNDVLINLGGGMITDMGGFIASIYQRGIAFINIPTSLLAMADASVGGKTGIDFYGFKNQLGVFANPILVACDPIFLKTLPQEEFLSGKAEMLKHGLIKGRTIWNEVKQVTPRSINAKSIAATIKVKNSIVIEDFKEENSRKKLNVGHTIGHAIESYFLTKNAVPHGWCVAWGLLVEAYLALNAKHLSMEDYTELENVITACYPKLGFPMDDLHALWHFLKSDKKNKSNDINFNLIKGFGSIDIDYTFSKSEIESAIANVLC